MTQQLIFYSILKYFQEVFEQIHIREILFKLILL